MNRVLIDTHVLLWALLNPSQLSETAREILANPDNTVLVSSATALEISTKHRLGKLDEATGVLQDYAGHLRRFLAEELAITSAHALLAGSFPQSHRDPFDRVLAAQSLLEGVPLLTNDNAFRHFPVVIVW